MSEEMIARMRDRIERTRKVIALAHDPRMIKMLEDMIAEAEADIARIQAESGQIIEIEIKEPPQGDL